MTMPADGRRRFELRGVVSSVGFESGDRFVIGHWLSSPIGAFTDLMWAAPDGTRHLRVPSTRALAFVSGIYAFDHASVAPVVATVTSSSVEVDAGDVGVDLHGGVGVAHPVQLDPRCHAVGARSDRPRHDGRAHLRQEPDRCPRVVPSARRTDVC